MPQTAYKFDSVVGPDGKLEVTVPVSPGTPVQVLILAPQADEFADLVEASGTTLEFWNNPQDEADWNNA